MIEAAFEALSDPFFVKGVIAGMVVVGAGVALSSIWEHDGPLPIGGLLVAAATMANPAINENTAFPKEIIKASLRISTFFGKYEA